MVPLGTRDSPGASVQGFNNDIIDLVALLGSHTIGDSRCTSFWQLLYNQTGNSIPDRTLDVSYAAALCPRSGGDHNLFFLDPVTPFKFDNQYYKNHRGLLNSDEVLFTDSPATSELVSKQALRAVHGPEANKKEKKTEKK
ncbi:hypothetical protein ACP70R_037595 [Stipagrostis hirtigluma subsp. patula]